MEQDIAEGKSLAGRSKRTWYVWEGCSRKGFIFKEFGEGL